MVRTTILLAIATLSLACGASHSCPPPTSPQPVPAPVQPAPDSSERDLVRASSKHDFATTLSKLMEAIEANGLAVMATVDHAANAANAGLSLPPTTVVIFGKPQVGTKLMAEQRTVAIDLPQKILVFADQAGAVEVVFTAPAALGARHRLHSPVLAKIRGLLDRLVRAATE